MGYWADQKPAKHQGHWLHDLLVIANRTESQQCVQIMPIPILNYTGITEECFRLWGQARTFALFYEMEIHNLEWHAARLCGIDYQKNVCLCLYKANRRILQQKCEKCMPVTGVFILWKAPSLFLCDLPRGVVWNRFRWQLRLRAARRIHDCQLRASDPSTLIHSGP